jgi:hypothetical protein
MTTSERQFQVCFDALIQVSDLPLTGVRVRPGDEKQWELERPEFLKSLIQKALVQIVPVDGLGAVLQWFVEMPNNVMMSFEIGRIVLGPDGGYTWKRST